MRRWAFIWIVAFVAGESRLLPKDVAPPAQVESWVSVSPEEAGLDSAALAGLFDFAREHDLPVHSVQIARHGRLVLDAYFHPYRDGMRHDIASVTKSITSTLVGLAIEKGSVRDVQQRVVDRDARLGT